MCDDVRGRAGGAENNRAVCVGPRSSASTRPDQSFRADTSGRHHVFRCTPAVGLPMGISFDGVGGTDVALNNRDDLVFQVSVTGPGVNGTNNLALYAWNPGRGLTPIVRTGALFHVGAGGNRTIRSFWFTGSGEESGQPTCLNDQHDFVLRFGSLTAARACSSPAVPSPATTVLLCGAGAACFQQRHRRA
jgi:hypothetical protein